MRLDGWQEALGLLFENKEETCERFDGALRLSRVNHVLAASTFSFPLGSRLVYQVHPTKSSANKYAIFYTNGIFTRLLVSISELQYNRLVQKLESINHASGNRPGSYTLRPTPGRLHLMHASWLR
jgi:hypothetical protein